MSGDDVSLLVQHSLHGQTVKKSTEWYSFEHMIWFTINIVTRAKREMFANESQIKYENVTPKCHTGPFQKVTVRQKKAMISIRVDWKRIVWPTKGRRQRADVNDNRISMKSNGRGLTIHHLSTNAFTRSGPENGARWKWDPQVGRRKNTQQIELKRRRRPTWFRNVSLHHPSTAASINQRSIITKLGVALRRFQTQKGGWKTEKKLTNKTTRTKNPNTGQVFRDGLQTTRFRMNTIERTGESLRNAASAKRIR